MNAVRECMQVLKTGSTTKVIIYGWKKVLVLFISVPLASVFLIVVFVSSQLKGDAEGNTEFLKTRIFCFKSPI